MTEGDAARDTGGSSPGRRWAIAGLVLAGLGLAMFPLGGLVGVVCGGIARAKGDHTLGLITIEPSGPQQSPAVPLGAGRSCDPADMRPGAER